MEIYHLEDWVSAENPTPGARGRLDILTEQQNAKALAGHVTILSAGDKVPGHYHERRESLLYFISGEVVETVDGREFPLKAGDVIYIAAGEKHAMENRSGREARYLEVYTPITRDVVMV